jgi:hypothetical protein
MSSVLDRVLTEELKEYSYIVAGVRIAPGPASEMLHAAVLVSVVDLVCQAPV